MPGSRQPPAPLPPEHLVVHPATATRPAQIVSKILAEVFRLIALGLAVGLPVLFFASRSLSSLLYGVTPNDPAALLAIISVLTGVAALAGLLPAIRASRPRSPR